MAAAIAPGRRWRALLRQSQEVVGLVRRGFGALPPFTAVGEVGPAALRRIRPAPARELLPPLPGGLVAVPIVAHCSGGYPHDHAAVVAGRCGR